MTRHRAVSTNCHLSRDDSTNLDVTSSYVFYPDAEWDYYQRIGSGASCFRRPVTASSTIYQHQPAFVIGHYLGSEGKTSRKFRFQLIPSGSFAANWFQDCSRILWSSYGFFCWMFYLFIIISFSWGRVFRTSEIRLPTGREDRAGFILCPWDLRVRKRVPAIPHFHLPILQLSVRIHFNPEMNSITFFFSHSSAILSSLPADPVGISFGFDKTFEY